VDRLTENVRVLQEVVGEVALIGPDDPSGPLGHLRRLPDAPGVDGSIAGLLAALRWDPAACWVVTSRWGPTLSRDLLDALLRRRKPGTWAILPRRPDGGATPYPGIYEPQSRALLEEFVRSGSPAPRHLAEHPKVALFMVD